MMKVLKSYITNEKSEVFWLMWINELSSESTFILRFPAEYIQFDLRYNIRWADKMSIFIQHRMEEIDLSENSKSVHELWDFSC